MNLTSLAEYSIQISPLAEFASEAGKLSVFAEDIQHGLVEGVNTDDSTH